LGERCTGTGAERYGKKEDKRFIALESVFTITERVFVKIDREREGGKVDDCGREIYVQMTMSVLLCDTVYCAFQCRIILKKSKRENNLNVFKT